MVTSQRTRRTRTKQERPAPAPIHSDELQARDERRPIPDVTTTKPTPTEVPGEPTPTATPAVPDEPLAKPATATPPANGHHHPDLMPQNEGVMFVWCMVKGDAYRLSPLGKPEERQWKVQKYSDGTEYHVREVWEGNPQTGEWDWLFVCDCPGCTAHGPKCSGGKGCKHARIIKAMRQLVDPGV